MSAISVRTGGPVPGTIITAGTPGTTTAPHIVGFVNSGGNETYASPCIIHNTSSVSVMVKVNNTTDFDGDSDDDMASAGVGHFRILTLGMFDASFGGLVRVRRLAFYIAAQTYAEIEVHGWIPGEGTNEATTGWPGS